MTDRDLALKIVCDFVDRFGDLPVPEHEWLVRHIAKASEGTAKPRRLLCLVLQRCNANGGEIDADLVAQIEAVVNGDDNRLSA